MKKVALAAIVLAFGLGLPAGAQAAFSPNRTTFQCRTPDNCGGAGFITFNSFTNTPDFGDERAFFMANNPSATAAAFSDSVGVGDGNVVNLSIYVDNNADPSLTPPGRAIARNVRVQVQLPNQSVAKSQQTAIAAIVAGNSSPRRIDDTVTFDGRFPFTVSYVAGSAKYQHGSSSGPVTVAVSDDIVGSGASLGDVKGGFKYAGFVTLQVQVHMPAAVPAQVTAMQTQNQTQSPPTSPLPATGGIGLGSIIGTSTSVYMLTAYRRSRKWLLLSAWRSWEATLNQPPPKS